MSKHTSLGQDASEAPQPPIVAFGSGEMVVGIVRVSVQF